MDCDDQKIVVSSHDDQACVNDGGTVYNLEWGQCKRFWLGLYIKMQQYIPPPPKEAPPPPPPPPPPKVEVVEPQRNLTYQEIRARLHQDLEIKHKN